MRLGRRRSRTLVVAFFQERKSINPVIDALRKRRLFRSAVVHISANEKPVVAGSIASFKLGSTMVVLGVALAALLARLAIVRFAAPEAWMHVAGILAAAIIGGWVVARLFDVGTAKRILSLHRRWILQGESLVVVSVRPEAAGATAELLSEAASEHPAVFVLHPPSPALPDPVVRSQSGPGDEELHLRVVRRAGELSLVERNRPPKGSLMPRLDQCEATLKRVQNRLAAAVRLEQGIALSAEWLLDNAYVVQGHIEDFRRNLPPRFYRELPFLTEGSCAGLPRVYCIASELVAEFDGALTKKGIEAFLQTFQSQTPLSMGELWALPMMLRLRLIEYLASLSVEVERRQSESERTAFWANRLLNTARRQLDRMPEMIASVASESPRPSPHVVEELLGHLYDEEGALTPVRAWLQSKFPAPLEEVVRQDEQAEIADQASLANSISTLRLLSQFDWSDVFEEVSRVEAVLWTDPAQVYATMDSQTRDRYRHVVERLSRRRGLSEEEVAEEAISLARKETAEPQSHVGYFLIDDGQQALERHLGVTPTIRQRTRRWITPHAAPVYLSTILVMTALLVLLAIALAGVPIWTESGLTALLALLFLLPACDLAIQLVNYLVTRCLEPHPLPKLSFEEEGIPDEFRTIVVVPMMLLTPSSIQDEVERLEIRALANPDANLRFALLGDYSDAPQQHMPEDFELLEVAIRGIERLNKQHGAERFVLFYRDRRWSESERCWMGWERKRGKLEELNEYLVGDPEIPTNVILGAGSPDTARGVKFVLTLDSDTQLTRDTGRRLVATLAHPLNRPHLTPEGDRVTRGYSIIQPRVSTSLPSATGSLFTRLFTDPTGLDPYTHAVSDVYQDLANCASYHGKGIYDLEAFHRLLSKRFPEAHLLSHDLIEGAYARAALASDIELLDLFPTNYGAYCTRQHRWIRGDWQTIDWLLPSVPSARTRREPNPISALDRWKILDNLRRSLTPIAILAMLLIGCAIAPRPFVAGMLVLALVLTPMLLPLLTRLTEPWKVDPLALREPALNVMRTFLFAAALPHQAWLSINAIARVLYRRTFSHRLLLEWAPASGGAPNSGLNRAGRFLIGMAGAPLFSIAAAGIVLRIHPVEPAVILTFAVLWAISPFVVGWLDRPLEVAPGRLLAPGDRAGLRHLARQTWRYFDDFVSAKTHWLPPDNYQEMLRVELAERTSPTNIGLYLLSSLGAHDFGYLSGDDLVVRVHSTLETLGKLQRYKGHLLNWYDTATMDPLGEPYVSTVDSGNLMGALWTLRNGLEELREQPLLGPPAFHGLSDTLALLTEYKPGALAAGETGTLARTLSNHPERLAEIAQRIRGLADQVEKLSGAIEGKDRVSETCAYWAKQLEIQVAGWNSVLDRYFTWLDVLENPPEAGLLALGPDAHAFRRLALTQIPSLQTLAAGVVPGLAQLLLLRNLNPEVPEREIDAWLTKLAAEAECARSAAQAQLGLIDKVLELIGALDREMEMSFLYDPERRLFAIGYNVAEQHLDRSYYDLLASEARLSSFLAIARGDVPTEHWWALGRPFGFAYLRRPLLSWNGTMFEYLMPLLMTRSYANSLLDQACRTAFDCQIAYAKKRGIPWGISESAYSALDSRQVYQYRAFGVPGLALRRGLEEDFVVSPYSSALALAIDPREAARHLRRRGMLARTGLKGDYGFYEAIDYTRQHEPEGERGLIVYTYMAHHQGMILLAIDNALGENVMQDRFHSDPRVRATASLLYERVPVAPPLVKTYPRESAVARLSPIIAVPAPGRVDTPDTATPRTCLLANGEYRLMISNAGGGYSRWKEFDITRWRADTTCDDWGSFCYLRDLDSGYFWSATHHPVGLRGPSYHAIFGSEKAEFRRRDRGIEAVTEVVVSPEDNAEVRRITLINRSVRPRRIELTSYMELALAPHAADRMHPAFNKMFIETAMLRDIDALLAWRRLRSPDETPIWVGHVITSDERSHEPTQFETDRARLIGRGHTVRDPASIREPLSGTDGYVLDPIFSLRRVVTIPVGERVQLSFVTVAAGTREQAVSLLTKYRDPESANRAFHLAWTQAQLELRHLRIKPSEVQLFQQLASHVLYPHVHLRATAERLSRNRLGQRELWVHGISGDLPIVVVAIDEAQHVDLIQDVLAAHTFWRIRGLVCDLVILNEEATSYEQPLQVQLQRMIAARSQYTGIDQPGGVFLRPAKQISPEDMTVLLSAANVVLVAARGTLSQQIGVPTEAAPHRSAGPERPMPPERAPDLQPLELQFANDYGGFTADGREYVVHLEKGSHTPRPWSNVIANPGFGCLITNEGSGFTWYGNSQSHRLSSWSNDPIGDPAAEAIFLFDPETNVAWTPTALPIREDSAYRARHGQGYSVFEHACHGIEQELTVFVPANEEGGTPVRIQRLRLTNLTGRKRSLFVTHYVELTLGTTREEAQIHVITNWDLESRSLFARNPFSSSYGGSVAFVTCDRAPESFTCDRTEIIGRNGCLSKPSTATLGHLSGRYGGGLDPCAAVQVRIDLEPHGSGEVTFLMGAAPDAGEARRIVGQFRRRGEVVRSLESTRGYWDDLLGTITVETPEKEMDLLFNRWLLYQTVSCRIRGRSGFYQSGGAYGYRDQLQDVTALVYSAPRLAREHILRCAGRQFIEGDVQHWWHEEDGAGVRTRITDDLLWLPYAAAHYVRTTGDIAILDESVPFIEGRLLDKGEHDAYFVPAVSAQRGTLLEHCRRAIEKATATGPHDLPLIGGGDWNDGMNLVGIAGKGESVWLGWFLVHVLRDFAELTEIHGDAKGATQYRARADKMEAKIQERAWDGEWYRRAYFDDGTPLGSKSSPEAQIDSLPQSWSAIAGRSMRDRAQAAMEAVNTHLVREDEGLVLLFTPPFDTSPLQPGYIKGYPPGVRENGGQYTHGSLWAAMAWARLGNGAEAVRLLRLMNPILQGANPDRYLVEPYVVAADVYALPGRIGMGGWTWYTGSSSWMYRIWLEEVLGFKLRGDTLTFAPSIPPDWPGYRMSFKFGSATYQIEVENPQRVGGGIHGVSLDDVPLARPAITLADDGAEHRVRVVMGRA